MRLLIRLIVLGLAAYGGKALYDKYGPAAKDLAGRRDELSSAVKRVSDRARGNTGAVAGHAKEAATDVAGKAKEAAHDVAGHAKEAAHEVAEESKQVAGQVKEQVGQAVASGRPGTPGSDPLAGQTSGTTSTSSSS